MAKTARLQTVVSKSKSIVLSDGVHDQKRPAEDICDEEECDDWMQLPLEDNIYDAHAAGNDDFLRILWNRERGMREIEESKSQLEQILNDKYIRMQLQKESIGHLDELVRGYGIALKSSHKEMSQTRACEGKLRSLYHINCHLGALQCTKEPMQVLHIIIAWLGHMLMSRVSDDKELWRRLILMNETNDSVWLLCAGRDWLLPKVQTILQLQLTNGDGPTCFPSNEKERIQLLQKFKGRLENWCLSLDKNQRFIENQSVMLWCWPEYPWVSLNLKHDIGYKHITSISSQPTLWNLVMTNCNPITENICTYHVKRRKACFDSTIIN